MHIRRKFIGAVLGLAVLAATLPVTRGTPSGDGESSVRIVVTHKSRALRSDAALRCDARIHAYLTFAEPLTGTHTLEGIWRTPEGEIEAHAVVPLDYPEPGRRTALLWLSPGRESGGVAGGVLGGGASPGRTGQWQLEIRLDRETVATESFVMTCS